MTGGVTVFGLVEGGYDLDDIRTSVPYQTAVQIPAHLAERSRNLIEALQQLRLLKLGNTALVMKPVSPLNPMLRGRGNPLALTAPKSEPLQAQWAQERESLLRELAASRALCSHQQGLNEALQAALVSCTGQLAQIQKTVEALAQQRGAAPAPTQAPTWFDSTVRHFIPATSLEPAEVRISLSESTSTSNLDEARAALRSLRGKSA